MFTPNSPSNNRLLALEQELMGWKTSPKPQQAQQEQDEQDLRSLDGISGNSACVDPPKSPLKRGTLRKFSPLNKGGWGGSPGLNTDPRGVKGKCVSPDEDGIADYEAETEEVAAWDSEIEEVEELEEAGEAEQFSYGGLAKMLQSSASERFKRNVTQLQAKKNGLEPLVEEEETVFAYPSRRDTLPSALIHSDRDALNTYQFSQLPELDLPRSDSSPELFDITLPEAEPDAPSPVPNFAFSSGEPSYTSLLQVIQSARQSEPTSDESDDPILSTAKTDRTIDVESHAIAEEQADSEPLSTPYTSLASSIEQPLLPADRFTDAIVRSAPAKPIAFGLEPIELEPISDEDDEDGRDESSDNQLTSLSPTNQD
jgi:hypothetical protein